MTTDVVNEWFQILDQSAEKIAEELNGTYLEGVAQTAENIVDGVVIPKELEQALSPLYSKIYDMEATPEQVRKAMQLVILKGMKNSAQPNHQMTPDAVALFIGYLVNKLPLKNGWTCLDLAVGTSNLLTAVLNHAEKEPGLVSGVDIDDLLMKLSVANINLQQHDVELHHQDSLRPLLIDPVDVVITDLPYGYYYDEEYAKKFQLNIGQRPLSHFLMIEQALTYTAPGGFLIFLIPNDLFTMDEDKKLHGFIQETAIVLGILQLPSSMFRDQGHAKSIMILRKKGMDVQKPKHALLAELPSFKNRSSMQAMMQHIDEWFKENIRG
ncbi:MAG: class I SAM-dependent methyltransferase [Tuberibacillus sp.]